MYTCICGKTFDKPNSFNGHKSHCKVHLNKTGRLHVRETVDETNKSKIADTMKQNVLKRSVKEQELWVAEKHTCEKCGRVMTEKYGSGRFCSKQCANSRQHSEATKKKIGDKNKLNNDAISRSNSIKKQYNTCPKYCEVCSKPIPYEDRYRKTCSPDCYRELVRIKSSNAAIKNGGNNNSKGVRGTAHYGTYEGYACDSSYELAVVIYCLEHNIEITRNNQGFDYVFNGVASKYYPDFIINGVYVETKNYWTEQVQAKLDQFPKSLKYAILYYEDIKPCIEYCTAKYGQSFTELYDRNYPSWMDKKV